MKASIWSTVISAYFVGIFSFIALELSLGRASLGSCLCAILGAFLGLITSTFFHELGHFFMGRLMGMKILRIRIGGGRLIKVFSFFGVPMEIRESLVGGAVYASLVSAKRARLSLFCLTAAGPVVSVALASLSVAVCLFVWPTEAVGSVRGYLFSLLVAWTISWCLILPNVLLPYKVFLYGRLHETDALRLLKISRASQSDIQRTVESNEMLNVDLTTLTLEQALDRERSNPGDATALRTLAYFLEPISDPRLLATYRKLLDLPLQESERTSTIDRLLTLSLEIDAVSTNSDEMDQYSLELVKAKPGDISAMGTRGSILVDMGRLEEGRDLLQDVMKQTDSTIDRFYSSIFLALAEKKLGNEDVARRHARVAAEIGTFGGLKRLTKAGFTLVDSEV